MKGIFEDIQAEGKEVPFPFNPNFVTHKITDYYREAGIQGANLHSLRKTFGSLLLQNGLEDLYTVSRLLGHASVKTTEKYYVDLLDENYRSSVQGLDQVTGTADLPIIAPGYPGAILIQPRKSHNIAIPSAAGKTVL